MTHAITESPFLGGRDNSTFLSHEPSSKGDFDFRFFIEANAGVGKAPDSSLEDQMSPMKYVGTVAWQSAEIHGVRLGSRRDDRLISPPARSFPRLHAAYCRGRFL